jgi:fumarylacetoacetase
VVPLAALRDAEIPLPAQEPVPLAYLRGAADHGYDVELVVKWNGQEVARPPYREMYWSPAQMLAHLTANGAALRTGDLFASGTISGPERGQRGAFFELTWGGAEPVEIGGERRTFLEDGDTVSITATAPGPDGTRIGFGEVRGTVLP